jgi:hypothetical protein
VSCLALEGFLQEERARVAQRLAVCTILRTAALAAARAAAIRRSRGAATACGNRCRCLRLLLLVGRHLFFVVLPDGVHSTH